MSIHENTLLSVEDLSIAIPGADGPVPLVDGVSFSMGSGEARAIVGESGSGKTLTAMAVMGLLDRRRLDVTGRVVLAGVDLLALDERGMRAQRGRVVALVPQDPMTALNPTFTIGQQLVETIRIHSALNEREARRRAVELLELVQITRAADRLDSYAHEFSGGMRQRVMIALALSGNPRLIIADEATSALDATTQAQIVLFLRELCRTTGTALLFITHDLGVVGDLCQTVNVMYAGRIVESGTVRDVFRTPSSRYSARLLSAAPDASQRRKSRLLTIEGTAPRPGTLTRGCRFSPRCADARDVCREQEPVLSIRAATHQARCWATDEGGWMR
ncbi:ABC transporter ATP-binding protein [Microbacterium ulmi]|uniref:ABC transporter ATP-binding protein n=1 Tax=Microbacterium ulmi TaxID=179095 RepID=A0A7Y2LYD4_9MICO|nr:ABC transporter ATP-binding protein [Microbacterium ulmi]NII68354.1 oligopeptide/dipeptide ABC transporter ATP-binding protein [Microbacterium ulmi]NNH03111.1 ABC transporter ATP-binding protein [Microbacterium ulmi]